MTSSKNQFGTRLIETLFYSIFFLFALQLLTDYVEAVYGFGLFGSSIPPELAALLLILSPLILLLLPHGLPRWAVLLLGILFLLSRAIEALLNTRGQLLITGVGIACLMLFLPSLLKNLGDQDRITTGFTLTAGLAVGLSLAFLFRALGSGLDITVDGGLRWLGPLLAVIAGIILPGVLPKPTIHPLPDDKPAKLGKITGLSIGIISVFIVLFYTFTNPGVIGRWTAANYLAVFAGVIAALVIFALLFTSSRVFLAALNRTVVLIWNDLFVLMLVLTILPYQVHFPSDLAQYPLSEPTTSVLASIPLALMIALFPIILLDFILFTREVAGAQPSWRKLGAGFSFAALFLLFMIMAHVFTTVYDYIPVVGPLFRDRFWLVYLIAGLGLALPVLLVARPAYQLADGMNQFPRSVSVPALIFLIGLGTLASIWITSNQPTATPSQTGSLRVFTYNVQQGYSEANQRNYDGQIALIRSMDPDILGLAESDSARIANGNADLVLYFADKLNMYSSYGPSPVTGTFGVALLSKYPLQNPRTFFMYSKGEQTAAAVAQINANGKTFNVYVTHLGNGGPIFQQEEILKDILGKDNVILMGDFNFRPYQAPYPLTTNILADAWLQKWPQGVEDSGLSMDDRIDYIFVSPGTAVLDARYLTDPQSDHPALYVELH